MTCFLTGDTLSGEREKVQEKGIITWLQSGYASMSQTVFKRRTGMSPPGMGLEESALVFKPLLCPCIVQRYKY